MLIIFGWGFTTTRVFGAVFPLLCPNCHNEQFWVLKRIRRWFTLFFIPIFPYESNHALMCPICGVGRELSGVELKRVKLFAETNSAHQAGSLRDEEYEARLEAIAEASDAQVTKGMTYVTSTAISSGPAAEPVVKAAPRSAPPTPSGIPPAPVAPPAVHLAESGAALDQTVFCVGCGTEFERIADAFCPRCGTARPKEVAASLQ